MLDQTNCLAEILHRYKISYLGDEGITREQATSDIRNIHNSIYSRICCLTTPEGPNSGLAVYATNNVHVDIYGNLLAVYNKVKNSKITDEICYLSANPLKILHYIKSH